MILLYLVSLRNIQSLILAARGTAARRRYANRLMGAKDRGNSALCGFGCRAAEACALARAVWVCK